MTDADLEYWRGRRAKLLDDGKGAGTVSYQSAVAFIHATGELLTEIERLRKGIDDLMEAANEYEQAPVIRAFLRQQSKATS